MCCARARVYVCVRERGVSENWETTFREAITGFRYFEIASSVEILARHARIIIPNNASVSFGSFGKRGNARDIARLRKVTAAGWHFNPRERRPALRARRRIKRR